VGPGVPRRRRPGQRSHDDWLFQATIVTVLAMWVLAFAYSILNPTNGGDVFKIISVGAPGLIGTMYGFRFRGQE
jgi:hypothetical protein